MYYLYISCDCDKDWVVELPSFHHEIKLLIEELFNQSAYSIQLITKGTLIESPYVYKKDEFLHLLRETFTYHKETIDKLIHALDASVLSHTLSETTNDLSAEKEHDLKTWLYSKWNELIVFYDPYFVVLSIELEARQSDIHEESELFHHTFYHYLDELIHTLPFSPEQNEAITYINQKITELSPFHEEKRM